MTPGKFRPQVQKTYRSVHWQGWKRVYVDITCSLHKIDSAHSGEIWYLLHMAARLTTWEKFRHKFFLCDRSISAALQIETGYTPVGYLILEMLKLDGAFASVSTQRLVLLAWLYVFKFARAHLIEFSRSEQSFDQETTV